VKTKKLGRTILLALLLAILTTGAAFASEGDQIDVTGYIMELNTVDGTITIDVDGDPLTLEDVYIILVGENFDFDSHLVGDLITVQGTVGEDDVILLTELKIMDRVKDQIKLQKGELDSNYCTNEYVYHPVAAKVADTYSVDYSVIEDYLCGEPSVPLGQIMLALQTAALLDGVDFTDYLDGFENSSWGQIWQELEIKVKPDKDTPPGQLKKQDGEGDPEVKIPPGQQKKEGDGLDLEELLPDWLPQEWFQKGKK